jgi:DNA polymerase-1
MKTIPCYLYNQQHPEDGEKEITIEAANWNHFFQTLVGDSTDGYAGCPTVGPTKAKRILDADPTWKQVVRAYKAQNLSEEDALVQARLARILRIENYNYKNRKIRLWNPD